MRIYSDQIRPYTKKNFYSLGTDGYGRSDTRKSLRNFFEVDKKYNLIFDKNRSLQKKIKIEQLRNETN